MKNFILDFSSLSVQIRSNKEIHLKPWIDKFLINKVHERNIQMNLFFGDEDRDYLRKENDFYCFIKDVQSRRNIRNILVIIRNILSDLYLELGIFMIHSSGIIYHNKSFIFIGGSNAGKTTIAKALKEVSETINDEILIIHKINNEYWVSSYPSSRHKMLLNNLFIKLGDVFFIKKAKVNQKHEINIEKAMKLLIDQVMPQSMNINLISYLLINFLESNNVRLLEHYPFNVPAFISEVLE
jgi:hypothetical protein